MAHTVQRVLLLPGWLNSSEGHFYLFLRVLIREWLVVALLGSQQATWGTKAQRARSFGWGLKWKRKCCWSKEGTDCLPLPPLAPPFNCLVQLSGFQIAVREGSSLWKCPAAKENMESSLKNLLCSCSDVLFTSVSFLCYNGKPKNLMHSNIGLMAILPVKVNFTDL